MSGEKRGVATPREQLSEVPLSELLALREKVGSREFSRVFHKEKKGATTGDTKRGKETPQELSSKKRPILRPAGPPRRPAGKDPRFADRSGAFDADGFDRAYAFLEEVRRGERAEVERELKGAEDEDRDRLRTLLERMKAQARAKRELAADREVSREWQKKEREEVGRGKKRFFLKKGELRKLQLESRLSGAGKRKRIDKRRKRLEKRSRKGIPHRRPQKDQN